MTTVSRVMSAVYFGARDISEWGVSLDQLSASDRRLAERWIKEAGGEVFVRIVRSIAASKGDGRTKLDSEYMLVEAAQLLFRNPGWLPGKAAAIVARRVVAEGDWRGRAPIGMAGLSNWIQRHLRLRRPVMQRRLGQINAAWNRARRPT